MRTEIVKCDICKEPFTPSLDTNFAVARDKSTGIWFNGGTWGLRDICEKCSATTTIAQARKLLMGKLA